MRHRLSGRRWSPIIILHKSKPHLCHHYAIGRVIPGISAVIRQLDLVHFLASIFATLFAITLILMLPALRLKPTAKARDDSRDKLTFATLLRSKVYRGNVLIYAACSASFFAWLTGSPFILSEMGYSPAVIGLSYVPQTIAFLIGGYGCRAALQNGRAVSCCPVTHSVCL